EIAADMPDEDGFTKLDYETYRKENLEASYTNPDSYFIALENGNYIGVSVLFKFKQNKDLYTGLTGVRRPYRRRGIATCLKVKAIEYAKKHNFAKIGTDNQSTNKPMRDLNDKLGFKKQYDWICYKKVIRQENATEK
ncbi:MAG: GNAT family N-acetyltransferase, partial [candidate division Zixibacteria bacterium]|nr:GNAT family N-acetyltransferase [candidate division Zixibacteria bacterium]